MPHPTRSLTSNGTHNSHGSHVAGSHLFTHSLSCIATLHTYTYKASLNGSMVFWFLTILASCFTRLQPIRGPHGMTPQNTGSYPTPLRSHHWYPSTDHPWSYPPPPMLLPTTCWVIYPIITACIISYATHRNAMPLSRKTYCMFHVDEFTCKQQHANPPVNNNMQTHRLVGFLFCKRGFNLEVVDPNIDLSCCVQLCCVWKYTSVEMVVVKWLKMISKREVLHPF